MSDVQAERHDPYAALRVREYLLFVCSRLASSLGASMLSAAIGWELYQRTGKALTLGWVGLTQAVPVFLFALHAGHVADTRPRKQVAMLAQLISIGCSLALVAISVTRAPVPLFFVALFCNTTAGAFANPARQALVRQLVPSELLRSGIAWNTTLIRVAMMVGAALGGALLAWTHHPCVVYGLNAFTGLVSVLLFTRLKNRPVLQASREPATWKTLVAGVRYIRQTHIILATISLDLFAVLLGGATTLLPVYARDILRVGPVGFGWLEAAPTAGALVMALALAHIRPFRRPGHAMLWAVAGFGVATIGFGLSKSMPVSLGMLFLTGALDMVSVVVRSSLVQTLTPHEMQGRVSAVNSVFITASNQIGGFESGVVAHYTSPVFSVVSGGIGTLVTVILTAAKFPTVTKYDADSGEVEEATA